MAVAHRADLESLLAFQIALEKELFHDAVGPLAVEMERLRRVAEVGTVHQRLQYLTTTHARVQLQVLLY